MTDQELSKWLDEMIQLANTAKSMISLGLTVEYPEYIRESRGYHVRLGNFQIIDTRLLKCDRCHDHPERTI